MVNEVNVLVFEFFQRIVGFLPNLIGGILVIIVGFLIGGILKRILMSLLSFFRIDSLLNKTRLIERKEVHVWEEIITEIIRWTVIILFLIPAFEIWGLTRATIVLNQFLFYLPNVIVAVIIAFVGMVASNLGADIVKSSLKTIGETSPTTLPVLTKWLILFFTILIVLNQLGVAQDLIRILFTGIVAMVAIAGGLAFGLGGQGVAKEILEDMKKKLK